MRFFDAYPDDETGLVVRVGDVWPEPYEPPPARAHLTERF